MAEKEKDRIEYDKNSDVDEKDIIKTEKAIHEKLKSSSSTFDFGKISDLEYLYDIFSSKYDDVHSLDYLTKTHKALLEQGYPQTPALNEYLFWTTISRRLQILYNTSHKQLLENSDKDTNVTALANTDFLKEIQKVTNHVNVLQETIDDSLEATKKVRDVVDLHRETCEKAEKFLKMHYGEYVKKNSISGKITDITDRAYWAFTQHIMQTDMGKEEIPIIWSEEAKFLVDKKLIPLEYMAFILRTSIEGLYYIAKIRSEKMPDINKEEAEKKLKELMLEWESLRDANDRELLK